MSYRDDIELLAPPIAEALAAPAGGPEPAWTGLLPAVGELIGLADEGATALVIDPRADTPSVHRARSTVDLRGVHIGQPVLLLFEGGDPARPIVTGVVRGRTGWPEADPPAQVEVDADGERLHVSAKEELVLRCGKASITLTRAGKVLIQGAYVSSRSSGVNRIKGGSVQLN